ncbi:hypothetical protein llap_6154 [Limosa lapponica baueri]|uniref:Integrase catalytic domain-containing protein n=1 Tax=Limosa lapponica baueri TaxID=1758121 RepID=A0A2I0UBW4_LIMLA|nr:hypothetical protein llap_6154 [Limosa lapponica baueri]
MPSNHIGEESVTMAGVTGGSQDLTVLEAEVSLTGNKWEKLPIVTGPDAPCILGIDYLRKGYFKDPRDYQWAFGVVAVEMEEVVQLSTLPGLSEDPSIVGLLRVEEQNVPVATTTVHRPQYRTNRLDYSRVQATVCFHLKGRPVYLELIAPGVETQSYYLPWTDPDCTGEGWEATVWSPTRQVAEATEGVGEESVTMAGVTGGSQDLTVLEAEVSLTGNKWEKLPIVTGPDAPCILGIDYLRKGYFKDPRDYQWAFGVVAVEMEEVVQLSTLPGLSEDPSIVGLLRVEEQNVPVATTTVHRPQYRTNRLDYSRVQATVCFHLKGRPVYLELIAPGVETQSYYLPWTDPDCTGEGWEATVWSPTRQVAEATEGVEKLSVKVQHVDAHIPKSWATEEQQNNHQVDQAAKIKVSQVDLDWQCKSELFLAQWAHDTSGHQGRDATYRWAHDQGVDLTMDTIAQVIHQCETCAEIKKAKQSKPLSYGEQWLKYKFGEVWQIDYISLPRTHQGKHYVLTMVEAITGWLETYAVSHATARNTILGLERQVLWRHGTPERIESDSGTHFRNNLIGAWAKEHDIEWIYHIPYHAPAARKVE